MSKKYCTFLRGVNVNGRTMKMAEVISLFEKLGLTDVKAVLASGNILFSAEDTAEKLRLRLEKAMSEHFKYEVSLYIKSKEEIKQMLQSVPFTTNERLHCYIFIIENGFEEELRCRFNACSPSDEEQSAIVNRFFYWQVVKGNTLQTDFSKILGQKSLKDKFTSRNIHTIEKVYNKL
ncbi:MAG: DUF1697 domain-containing protein [Paludibacteraceae bacterium]